MRFSTNFTLKEMLKSRTADRLGIDNTTQDENILNNLVFLCKNILEPVRAHFESPVLVESGYRCTSLNSTIGGSPNSQHLKGEAADFEVLHVSNLEVAEYIRDHLLFDQLILENYIPGDPSSGWVHCSLKRLGGNRSEVLTYSKKKYYKGLVA